MVLLYRSKLPMQTQDVEGRNSKLQGLYTRAPRTGKYLANARMSLCFGETVTARECAAMHDETIAYTKTEEHANRFCPLVSVPVARAPPAASVGRSLSAVQPAVAGAANGNAGEESSAADARSGGLIGAGLHDSSMAARG